MSVKSQEWSRGQPVTELAMSKAPWLLQHQRRNTMQLLLPATTRDFPIAGSWTWFLPWLVAGSPWSSPAGVRSRPVVTEPIPKWEGSACGCWLPLSGCLWYSTYGLWWRLVFFPIVTLVRKAKLFQWKRGKADLNNPHLLVVSKTHCSLRRPALCRRDCRGAKWQRIEANSQAFLQARLDRAMALYVN